MSRCGACNGTGMRSGVPHPAVVTHPVVGACSGQGHPHPHSYHNPHSPNQQRNSFAKGTPMHFASMAGLPPPGVSPVDLCIMCHGSGLRQYTIYFTLYSLHYTWAQKKFWGVGSKRFNLRDNFLIHNIHVLKSPKFGGD